MQKRSNKNHERRIEQERSRKKDTEALQKVIESDLNTLSSRRIKAMMEEVKIILARDTVNRSIKQRVFQQLKNAEQYYEKVIQQENMELLESSRTLLEDEIRQLQHKKEVLAQTKEDKKNATKCDLDIRQNRVFIKNELTEEEIDILKEEGYVQCNEYCVEQQKNIIVLVKQVLNHSKTHTFLVWSVKNLLENEFDVKNLQEHDTKDADITFTYKNKTYALEVETGSWLKKKKQLEDKVKQLNRKYKNRWIFIVSNKNLVTQYNEFGIATQRKYMAKRLKKMLKI